LKPIRIPLTAAQCDALAPIIAEARKALTPNSLFAEVRVPTWPDDPSALRLDVVALPKVCADRVRKVVDQHFTQRAATPHVES
jgi:hypothetical protein